jgi:hypothetical protein
MHVLPGHRELVAAVAKRWKEQYFSDGRWGTTIDGSAQVAYKRLLKLDPKTATVADVEAIIGVGGWTSHFCSECHKYHAWCVDLGYTDYSVTVCLKCLRKAVRMLEKAQSADAVSGATELPLA